MRYQWEKKRKQPSHTLPCKSKTIKRIAPPGTVDWTNINLYPKNHVFSKKTIEFWTSLDCQGLGSKVWKWRIATPQVWPVQKIQVTFTLPETNISRTWKWMVGILVSFWDGLFSGAMLVLGRVNTTHVRQSSTAWLLACSMLRKVTYFSDMVVWWWFTLIQSKNSPYNPRLLEKISVFPQEIHVEKISKLIPTCSHTSTPHVWWRC